MTETQNSLDAVEYSQKPDGSWLAVHVPSGKTSHGLSRDEADESMKQVLGMAADGEFEEAPTHDRFAGVAREIALFLEGDVSKMLKFHSGYARLEAYEGGICHVKLGGGCHECPSSTLTLLNGVRGQLIDKFGEDFVVDVEPVVS